MAARNEKPMETVSGVRRDEVGRIQGGIFAFEPAVLEVLDGEAVAPEPEPLDRVPTEGELMAHRHDGFWQATDALHQKRQLNVRRDSVMVCWS